MWKLVIEDDEGKRTVVPLTRAEYTIGRKDGNNIRLTERNVSRNHARLRRSNGAMSAYTVEDLSSYNGVYVNGVRVADRQDLHHGDLLQIGDYRVILQDDTIADSSLEELKATVPSGSYNRASLLLERPNRFVMLAGPTPGAEFALDKERLTIGRSEEAAISVNHSSVSRMHCEVHALGEGRFEIIDKGSSNGVRVNGVDLKRRIIEAGDILELGDVKLKFVGEGQIFLPGLEDRGAISGAPGSEQRADAGGGYVPWIILGALLALGVVAGIQYKNQRRRQAPVVQEDPDKLDVQRAEKICPSESATIAGCAEALQILAPLVQRGSSALQNEEGGYIPDQVRARWLNALVTDGLNSGNAEYIDLALQNLPESDARKAKLREKRADLDKQRQVPLAVSSLAPTPTVPPSVAPAPAPRPAPTPTPPPVVNTTPARPREPVSHPGPPPTHSEFERASELALQPGKQGEAKRLLWAKLTSGRTMSREEMNLLCALCQDSKDSTCLDRCKAR